MKHGYECKCPGCAIGRTLGVIKKPTSGNKGCGCGSGKLHEECCGGGHSHDEGSGN